MKRQNDKILEEELPRSVGAQYATGDLWRNNSRLFGKDSDAGRDWGQEEKGTTEDEMAGWHHWLDGCESEWTRELVMDREAWRAAIHGVTKSQTRLSDWIELNWSIGCSGTVFLVCEYVTTTNPVLPVRLDIEYHGHILPCLVPSCLTGQKGWDDISFWRNSQHSKPTVCDCEHHAGNTKD